MSIPSLGNPVIQLPGADESEHKAPAPLRRQAMSFEEAVRANEESQKHAIHQLREVDLKKLQEEIESALKKSPLNSKMESPPPLSLKPLKRLQEETVSISPFRLTRSSDDGVDWNSQ